MIVAMRALVAMHIAIAVTRAANRLSPASKPNRSTTEPKLS